LADFIIGSEIYILEISWTISYSEVHNYLFSKFYNDSHFIMSRKLFN
jgi:hypothetical protein